MTFNNKGFSMIEVFVTLTVLSILMFAIGSLYIVGTRAFNSSYNRFDSRSSLTTAIDHVKAHLQCANTIDDISVSSLEFTSDLGTGDETYRVYLYHPDDPEPNPPYTQETYELRFATSDTSYGEGVVLATDIKQPKNIPFSQNNNVITLDWTTLKNDVSLRMRTKVRPRNL